MSNDEEIEEQITGTLESKKVTTEDIKNRVSKKDEKDESKNVSKESGKKDEEVDIYKLYNFDDYSESDTPNKST